MKILDGKFLSCEIFKELALKVQNFKEEGVPGLAVCLIGDNPASQVYVRNKIKACETVGFYSLLKKYPAVASPKELKQEITALNKNPKIHGILVQLPLPSQLCEKEVLSWIDPKKDVDALTLENQALLWSGKPRIVPCTPKGIISLLKYYEIPISSRQAVVVGRSQIVGLPVFQQLLSHNATVTICHSHTKHLSSICQTGDIVVVCAGKRHFFSQKDFKKGAVVVDVGIHKKDNKLYGGCESRRLGVSSFCLNTCSGGGGAYDYCQPS